MNKQIAFKRLTDVLNVDSINSTQADFLSTHVPFRKITVTNDLSGTPIAEYISEDEVFNKYFNNSDKYDEHQLIVVDGSSGSGKSHFIRWIEAKLEAAETNNDVVLMIRRSDNTLKGTIRQFLDIEEVKNLKNKDIYERLVKANQNVSELKFKYNIYHEFLVALEIDKDETILSASDKEKFKELLSSSEFSERMMKAGGPIERIYSKIVDCNTSIDKDVYALFEIEDFILDYDFNMKLKDNASKKAVKMANKLLPEVDGSFADEECNPEILVRYMNAKVEPVIKECAGLGQGDFQQIFKEIRQELFNQGKNLILLIEDITSCTGINRDLLDALIVKHTGENAKDKMCRLVSVIGTTTEYFKEFRSNYLDRITTMVTIEDGSIGNNTDDLIQFVAKYLNVMSISSEVINKWYKDGALDSEYPIHEDTEVKNWEYYTYLGKKISLYPFTKRAIVNLYNGIDVHKTPRYILRKIIEPAVDGIIKAKKMFPNFLLSKKPNLIYEIVDRIKSTITNMQLTQDEKNILTDRVLAIMSYWGDGTLDDSKKGFLGAIGYNVFIEFELGGFVEKVLGKSLSEEEVIHEGDGEDLDPRNGDPNLDPDPSPVIPPQPQVNKAFDSFTKILSDWHYEKKSFTKAYQVRDEICKFIFASISWQQEGVPLISVQMVEKSSYDLVEIERQDKKVGKGLVFLEDNDENYQLLLAIGKSWYLGKKRENNIEYASWDFEGAASSLRVVTRWLEKNKNTFVEIVKAFNEKEKYPDYLKCSIVAEVYRSLLNGDAQVNKLADFKAEILLKDNATRKKNPMNGHSVGWTELVNNIVYANGANDENIDTIQRYFNLIQGNAKNAKRKIINYNLLESVFKDIKSNQFSIDIESVVNDEKIPARNSAKDYLKKIISRIDKAISDECNEGRSLYENALTYFDFPLGSEIETEDIKDLLNEIIEFYGDTETCGVNVALKTYEAKEIRDKGAELSKAFSIVSEDVSHMDTLDKLVAYSKNPMKIIKQFILFIKAVDDDRTNVYNQMLIEKEALTRSGNWSDDVDPRFDDNKLEFDDLMKLVEE
nr:hypothetical protein [uncultured Anaerosporobacter sp.]